MIDVESLHPSPVVGLASLLVSTVLSNLFFFWRRKISTLSDISTSGGLLEALLRNPGRRASFLEKNVVTGLCYRRYCTLAKGWFVDGNKGLNKR